MIDMNEPITIERAQIGRAMYFPQIEWESQITTFTTMNWQGFNYPIQSQEAPSSECGFKEEKIRNAAFFNRLASSRMKIRLHKEDRHHQMHLKLDIKPGI